MRRKTNKDRQDKQDKRHGNPVHPVYPCLIVALGLLWAASAAACVIPVFQYACENWPLDSYELIVFHKGAAETEPIVRDFTAAAGKANVRVMSVDVADDMDEPVRRLWESLCAREASGGDAAASAPELPLMVLCYPQRAPALLDIWSAAPDEAHTAALFDSPARTEIVKSLQRKECATVWVLLESGDAAKDATAERLLKEQLDKTNRSLSGPVATGTPITAEPGNAEPHSGGAGAAGQLGHRNFSFPMLKISRGDPAEQILTQMLLHSEADLRTFNEPIAFPIYGRGRILYALVGDGINANTIGEACRFLVDGCSCVIKAENPGTDLLLTAGLPAAPSRSVEKRAMAVDQVDAIDTSSPPLPDPLRGALWSIFAGLGVAFALAVAASFVIALRQRNA